MLVDIVRTHSTTPVLLRFSTVRRGFQIIVDIVHSNRIDTRLNNRLVVRRTVSRCASVEAVYSVVAEPAKLKQVKLLKPQTN